MARGLDVFISNFIFDLDLMRSQKKGGKCRLFLLSEDLEESHFLGSQGTEGQGGGGDGGHGSSSRGQDEASSRGEGGGGDGVQEEDWLGHGHAQQADGKSDSE